MAVRMEQVLAELCLIEPDYKNAAKLGTEAIPHLERLASGSDVSLATKAVYLASLIGGDRAVDLLFSAARSPTPEVRVQAAAAARNVPGPKAANILFTALDDSDVGVRNVALKSTKEIFVTSAMSAAIRKKIEKLATSDSEEFIRELSNDLLRNSNPT